MVTDFLHYVEMKNARQVEADAAQRAEVTRRVNLEWVLADLLADIQAA